MEYPKEVAPEPITRLHTSQPFSFHPTCNPPAHRACVGLNPAWDPHTYARILQSTRTPSTKYNWWFVASPVAFTHQARKPPLPSAAPLPPTIHRHSEHSRDVGCLRARCRDRIVAFNNGAGGSGCVRTGEPHGDPARHSTTSHTTTTTTISRGQLLMASVRTARKVARAMVIAHLPRQPCRTIEREQPAGRA